MLYLSEANNTQAKGEAMNKQLLNTIQAGLIKVASENGINLADEFKTRDEWKKFVFSFTIRSVMDVMNWDLPKAWNAVNGDGHFEEFSNNLFEQLQAGN